MKNCQGLFGKIFGKYPIRKIKREEEPNTFKLVIGMQIIFGILLLVISVYIYSL